LQKREGCARLQKGDKAMLGQPDRAVSKEWP